MNKIDNKGSMIWMGMWSLYDEDPEGSLTFVSPLLEDQHCFYFYVCWFYLVKWLEDVLAYWVLEVNSSHLGGCIRVLVDRYESVQVCHHQVTMNKLKQVYCVSWLVGCRFQLHQGPDVEAIVQVDFQNSRVGSCCVPCEDDGGVRSLASRIPHLKDPRLNITYVLHTARWGLRADNP